VAERRVEDAAVKTPDRPSAELDPSGPIDPGHGGGRRNGCEGALERFRRVEARRRNVDDVLEGRRRPVTDEGRFAARV